VSPVEPSQSLSPPPGPSGLTFLSPQQSLPLIQPQVSGVSNTNPHQPGTGANTTNTATGEQINLTDYYQCDTQTQSPGETRRQSQLYCTWDVCLDYKSNHVHVHVLEHSNSVFLSFFLLGHFCVYDIYSCRGVQSVPASWTTSQRHWGQS